MREDVRQPSSDRQSVRISGFSVLGNGTNETAAVPIVSSNGLHTGLLYACAVVFVILCVGYVRSLEVVFFCVEFLRKIINTEILFRATGEQ